MASLTYDVAVIGGGPGGLISTLYLRRYKRRVILVHGGIPRARWIPRIRNLAAHTGGLSGPELLFRLREQVEKLKPDFIEGEAKVSRSGSSFLVTVNRQEFRARKVILATGIEDIQPPLENCQELRRKGLLGYCPICDGFDHSKDPVALFVGDKEGLKKMKFIAHLSPDLRLILFGSLKIPPKQKEEMKKLGIKAHRGLRKAEQVPGKKMLRLHFRRGKPLDVKLAYVGLGAKVRDSAFGHLKGLRRTKDGYILVSYHQETSIPGLYAVGDCVNALAQVSVAVGQGAIAATRVHNELGFQGLFRAKS